MPEVPWPPFDLKDTENGSRGLGRRNLNSTHGPDFSDQGRLIWFSNRRDRPDHSPTHSSFDHRAMWQSPTRAGNHDAVSTLGGGAPWRIAWTRSWASKQKADTKTRHKKNIWRKQLLANQPIYKNKIMAQKKNQALGFKNTKKQQTQRP